MKQKNLKTKKPKADGRTQVWVRIADKCSLGIRGCDCIDADGEPRVLLIHGDGEVHFMDNGHSDWNEGGCTSRMVQADAIDAVINYRSEQSIYFVGYAE